MKIQEASGGHATSVGEGPAGAQAQLSLLSGMLEASRLLKGESDPESLYWTVVETILKAAEADACALALEDESEERLVLMVNGRLERRRILRSGILEGRMIGSQVFREGTVRALPVIPADPPPIYPAYVAKHGFRSGALFPVLVRSGIAGVLSLYYRRPGCPRRDAFELLVLVNQVASVALENATLFRKVQRGCFSTIQALASAIDAASPATHGHSQRVTQYALILGEKLGAEADVLTNIQYGALLHDIGKIGIGPSILEKQGRLSPEEYEAMKEHPVIGERIIAPVEFLQPARPIVRHHHERWDGKGYPDRLRGEEIPLGARIVALADFYDAMVSVRPYKRSLDPGDVAAEIEKCAGSAFDPDLAAQFLTTIRISA